MNSIKLRLGIRHYCESSVNANCSKRFGAFRDHEPQPQSVAWHRTATENTLLRLDALLFPAVFTIHPSCCCCSCCHCFDLKCCVVLYSPGSWPLLQVGALVLLPAFVGQTPPGSSQVTPMQFVTVEKLFSTLWHLSMPN